MAPSQAWKSLKRLSLERHLSYEDVILKVARGKGHVVDEKLKVLMQELGNAINESLSDSDRIAAAIGEIRRAGYDVFLVLEATIGFNKREEEAGEAETPAETPRRKRSGAKEFDSTARIKWTSQDQKFLRALKIAIDNESH
jgi:hypothetical protein